MPRFRACFSAFFSVFSPAFFHRCFPVFFLLLCLLSCALPPSSHSAPAFDGITRPETPGGVCTPSVTAPPCAHADAAGMPPGEPVLNLGIGNPVHLATGAKHQFDVDLPGSVAQPTLEIVRHYNSLRPLDSPLGAGWQFSYDVRVTVNQGIAQVEQASGARVVFDASSDPQQNGTLQRKGSGWQWRWPDGRLLDFDDTGYLVRIQPDTHAPATEIVRHRDARAPAIAHVRSGTARLNFSYAMVDGRPRLTAIDSPAGRFTYQVETATAAVRLGTVTRPDGMQRRYLYEADHQSGNATLPTGIVLEQTADVHTGRPAQELRISAWDYDAFGRVTGVAWGERTPENGYSRIRYLRTTSAAHDGITQVEGPAGKTRLTLTQRAGTTRLIKVEGAGCPGCPAPGTRASYDGQGRLLSVNDVGITRNASGQPTGIAVEDAGWPGLRMRFSATGAHRQWESALTGVESTQDHPATRKATRRFANGDEINVQYDDQGKPLSIRESRGGGNPVAVKAEERTPTTITTHLQWQNKGHDKQLHCVQHPFATEIRRYDTQGRVNGRTEVRPLLTAHSDASNDPGIACAAAASMHTNAKVWRLDEGFQYDEQGRLTTHTLPEGGAVHYTWGAGEQLQGIVWEDASGARHPVITSVPGQPGYRYGNGLHLVAAHEGRAQMSLTLFDASGARWRQVRQQDEQGRTLHETYTLRPNGAAQDGWTVLEDWRYAYDPQNRMTGAQDASGTRLWFAWRPDGALAALRQFAENAPPSTSPTLPAAEVADATDASRAVTRKPVIARDAAGMPGTLDTQTLHYGANRRLAAVTQAGKTLARYAHDAYGQRIRTTSGGVSTDYLYRDHRLVAETRPADHPANYNKAPVIARRYLYAHHVPVGMIVYDDSGHGDLYAIVADLLGAPRMVTDANGTLRWLAAYTPLGEVSHTAGDMVLHMRLPGQWFDPATHLHDNVLRTYAPQWGQYLEPDPIGPVPGGQALGYAAQQPRRFVDPLGLLLFAFDGTRHSERTHSNVMKFLQQYQDGPAYYHGGPGNPYTLTWDAVTAYSAPHILEAQWFNLLVALKQANASPWLRDAKSGAVPIDVIGFSRGAALARHFGNLIARQTTRGLFSWQDADLGLISACVDLRFMGLLDTVAQFGVNGLKDDRYDFGIAEVWRWVTHAVAMHEHRWAFPLTSTRGSENTHVFETPFIGAHGDIGGGNLLDPSDQPRSGDLSDVALNWLWWQAQAAGVPLAPLADDDRIVQEPILHDARIPLTRIQDTDRSVLNANGKWLYIPQALDPLLGETKRHAVAPLIHQFNAWYINNDIAVGEVDMRGYAAWLQQELGWGASLLPPQNTPQKTSQDTQKNAP